MFSDSGDLELRMTLAFILCILYKCKELRWYNLLDCMNTVIVEKKSKGKYNDIDKDPSISN